MWSIPLSCIKYVGITYHLSKSSMCFYLGFCVKQHLGCHVLEVTIRQWMTVETAYVGSSPWVWLTVCGDTGVAIHLVSCCTCSSYLSICSTHLGCTLLFQASAAFDTIFTKYNQYYRGASWQKRWVITQLNRKSTVKLDPITWLDSTGTTDLSCIAIIPLICHTVWLIHYAVRHWSSIYSLNFHASIFNMHTAYHMHVDGLH